MNIKKILSYTLSAISYQNILIITGVLFVIISAGFNLFNYFMPQNEAISFDLPPSHYISFYDSSPIAKQSPYMCAGYSVSFLKQYYNYIDSSGKRSYRQMAYSLPMINGVPPFRLVNYLNKNNFNTDFYRGNLRNLFGHIVNDRPVIVLVGNSLNWQHYIVLLGYDVGEEKLYFYDPLKPYLPSNDYLIGNKVLSFDEFKEVWANGLPIYNHLYIPANFVGLSD